MVHVRRIAHIPGNGRILFDRQGESVVWWIQQDAITEDGARWLETILRLLDLQYERMPVLAG